MDRVQQRLGGACWCSTLRGTVMSSMRALLRTSVLLASWVGCAPAATAEESGAACSPEQLKSLLRRSDATIARLEARMLDLEWQVGWEPTHVPCGGAGLSTRVLFTAVIRMCAGLLYLWADGLRRLTLDLSHKTKHI